MIINVDKFNEIVESKGMKLQFIARKAHLTGNTISRMRKGESVRPTTVCRVASVLDCKASDLLD